MCIRDRAYCDVSTGEIYSTDISGAGRYENLLNELVKIDAREIILDEATAQELDVESIRPVVKAYFNFPGEEFYRSEAARNAISCLLYTSRCV